MTDIAITCSDIWKSYRVYHQRSHTLKEKVLSRRSVFEIFWALRGVNLEVAAGTTVGIIGANASGKSTLLKTMAGILSPDRGDVRARGRISPLLELGTGFHPDLTGHENVYLGGSLLGCSRRDIAARYDEIVEFAGIGQFIDMPIKNYSSGMYARLAFALAVSVEPEILIIDEILSVGDEEFQMQCQQRMAEFRRDGRTIVLVSHNVDTISALCHDAVWLEKGVVRESGEAHSVVAKYIGEVHRDAEAEMNEGEPPPEAVRRRAGRAAKLTDVLFLDGDGAAVTEYRTGDTLTMQMRYETREPLADLIFSVAVYSSEGHAYVFGQNSGGTELPVVTAGGGTMAFIVPSLPLLPGTYIVTIALTDAEGTTVHDLRDGQHSFSVLQNPALPVLAGVVHMAGQWKATTPAPVPQRAVRP